MKVDLHTHSIFSDGTLSPEEIIKVSVSKQMKVISITDHDTIDGLYDANKAANAYGLEFVNGIEFSCNEGDFEVHILGYFLDLEDKDFLNKVRELEEVRNFRNSEIISKFKNMGIEIDIEKLKKMSSGKIIGRVHFANYLLQLGIVKDINEAFSKYLAKGGLAYVPKVGLPPELAVDIIRKNKGFSSLAHPHLITKNDDYINNLVKSLVEHGLNGIEINYPTLKNNEKNKFKNIAKKYGLIHTGGSDFHGDNRKSIDIGDSGLTYEQFEKIKKFKEGDY